MGLERRRNVVAAPAPFLQGPPEGGLEAKFPLLWEFLCRAAWDDGAPRLTGTVLVFVDGGALKARLSDRDASQVCFVSGPSWLDVLAACEGALEPGGGEWRADKAAGSRRGK